MIKLSFVIPAYNVEKYLPKCLDSILQQKGADFEVVVVDDGSSDDTRALLDQYAEENINLKVISQANAGMSTARNRGLEEAQGEYVMFVDSDDWLCDNALATIGPHLNGEDVVCFDAKKYIENEDAYVENNRQLIENTMRGWDYFNQQRLLAAEIHFVCIWQRAYKVAFLKENELRFAEGILRAEDDLFTTMVMYHAQRIKTINECLYVYRVRERSITTTVDINRWRDSLKVQKIMADFFVPLRLKDKHVIYQVLASNYINCFSKNTKRLYGNHDAELKQWMDWGKFQQVCVTRRHKRLYWLVRISPVLFRFYESVQKAVR